jgi:hypothetical protein
LATAFKNQFTTLKVRIKYAEFKKFLDDNFTRVADCLVVAMFERFKPFRLQGIRDNISVVNETTMDVLDFILSMNLLARIVYDKKLKLLFELCDDDDDGCMTPEDILSMLQRVERIFAQETARVDLQSSILDNYVADKKAELNFHFMMGMIKSQNLQKNIKLKMNGDKSTTKDLSNQRAGESSAQGAMAVTSAKDQEEDNLITYREFVNAIKSLKSLYKTILPRTLSFEEVLKTRKSEQEFTLSETQVDDFGMFRYEMNSIVNQHYFVNEQQCERFMGMHPLSKTKNGKQIKNLDEVKKQEYEDIYRPPGIVRVSKVKPGVKAEGGLPSMLESTEPLNLGNTDIQQQIRNQREKVDRQIWLAVPQSKLYTRINEESELAVQAREKKNQKYDMLGLNNINLKSGETGKEEKKGEKVQTKPGSVTLSEQDKKKKLDDLFKIKL